MNRFKYLHVLKTLLFASLFLDVEIDSANFLGNEDVNYLSQNAMRNPLKNKTK